MTDKRLKIEQLLSLVQELIKEGYGEIIFKVLVKKGEIEYVSLTKTTTHQGKEA